MQTYFSTLQFSIISEKKLHILRPMSFHFNSFWSEWQYRKIDITTGGNLLLSKQPIPLPVELLQLLGGHLSIPGKDGDEGEGEEEDKEDKEDEDKGEK